MVRNTTSSDAIARLIAEAPPFDEAQASVIIAALAGHLPSADPGRAA